MQKLITFETGKSNIDAVLFMVHEDEGFKYVSELEWMAEAKNREDLVKNGFKIKKLATPWWIKIKCGDLFADKK